MFVEQPRLHRVCYIYIHFVFIENSLYLLKVSLYDDVYGPTEARLGPEVMKSFHRTPGLHPTGKHSMGGDRKGQLNRVWKDRQTTHFCYNSSNCIHRFFAWFTHFPPIWVLSWTAFRVSHNFVSEPNYLFCLGGLLGKTMQFPR